MHNTRETLIDWLRDAHGMEHNLVTVLERHVKDSESFPEARVRFEAHLAQTRRHAERVQECLERLGDTTSTGKDMAGKIAGYFSGMTGRMADDTLVKDFLADYSMEHFEIASYKALIAAAEALGETFIAETCRDILRDEEEMARWLESHLAHVTQNYLAHAGH